MSSSAAPPPYKIVKQARAWWPVRVEGLQEDGSSIIFEMKFRFLRLKVDEAAEYLRDVIEAQSVELGAEVDLPALYAELVARIADNWSGILLENDEQLRWDVPDNWRNEKDEKGKRKPLVAPNLKMLMNDSGMFKRIFDAWRACVAGERERHEGN